jgi:hypothetical protein
MRLLFTRLIVALAILVCSIASPVLAGSNHLIDDHAVEIVDVDHHADEATDDGTDPSPELAAQHHHCTVGVFVPGAPLCATNLIAGPSIHPALSAVLVSWDTLPATEPRAA